MKLSTPTSSASVKLLVLSFCITDIYHIDHFLSDIVTPVWLFMYECVCVCAIVHRSVDYVRIMRWRSSNLIQRPLQNLGSVAYYYKAILEPPCPILLPSDILTGGAAPSFPGTPSNDVHLVFSQDHLPTRASPVSLPA